MIDLEHAAEDLIAAGRVEPDLSAVRGRADRRRRRRRVASGLAALVLLAAGAVAAARFADEAARDAVVTGPSPDAATTATDPDTEPFDPWSASQPVDLGGLRVRVPPDWQVVDAATDPGGGCGGPATAVIGEQGPAMQCAGHTALRVALLEEPLHGGGEPGPTRDGLATVLLGDDPVVWAVPELGVRLTFGPGVDPEPFLGTIQRTPGSSEPEIGAPEPIVLPCGTVVVANRALLDLPTGLDVPLADGMGGWAPGTDLGPCAVNLTDPDDPARHVTFVDGTLPYGLGEELSGEGTRAAGVRWGTIEDGYGGAVTRGEATFAVLAYGIDEEEAARLFDSLAQT